MHSQMQTELADVTVRPLLMSFGRSWWSGEIPEDWKKANLSHICKMARTEDLENFKPFNLT